MLHSHLHNHHKFLLPNLPVSLTTHHFSSPSPLLLNFLHNKSTLINPNPPQASFSPPWLTKLTTATAELGDAINDSSSIQVTFSVLLTAAITVFFFPILQRRIKRAKQLKFRSSGVKKSSLDSSKVLMGSTSIKAKKKNPPSPDQALLGAIIAGVISLILYRFTTTIEASLFRQSVSDNFSVRQITITIRTVINGLCYLATFVYGINSFGLLLYSGQLAINTYVEESSEKKITESKIMELSNSSDENLTNSNTNEDQSSNNSQ
ncbi:uncharacterized protein [Cicer arietinum]|uniref:Uncharacterized protein LOC101490464 n=1 Tax=Cicer arietinum TaxID=3827 RepID=A0A1S2XUW1_CICAR|nr:uncharacterized protein LOC101490464 [Cicer arietinum]